MGISVRLIFFSNHAPVVTLYLSKRDDKRICSADAFHLFWVLKLPQNLLYATLNGFVFIEVETFLAFAPFRKGVLLIAIFDFIPY